MTRNGFEVFASAGLCPKHMALVTHSGCRMRAGVAGGGRLQSVLGLGGAWPEVGRVGSLGRVARLSLGART